MSRRNYFNYVRIDLRLSNLIIRLFLFLRAKFLSRKFFRKRGERKQWCKAELCHGFARDTFFFFLHGFVVKGRRNFPSRFKTISQPCIFSSQRWPGQEERLLETGVWALSREKNPPSVSCGDASTSLHQHGSFVDIFVRKCGKDGRTFK